MNAEKYALTNHSTVWEGRKPVGGYWIVNNKTGYATFYEKNGEKSPYLTELGALFASIRSNTVTFPERNFDYRSHDLEVLNA